MAELFSPAGIMKLIIAVVLDIATLFCLMLYLLGPIGIFVGEMFSYFPKILSVVFLGNWNLKAKKGKLKNKKILLKLVPAFGNLPLNTIYVISELRG